MLVCAEYCCFEQSVYKRAKINELGEISRRTQLVIKADHPQLLSRFCEMIF